MPARRTPTGNLLAARTGLQGRRLASLADLGIEPDELAWHGEANCSDTDPDAFFPDLEYGGELALVRRVCAACPVRAACRDYAMARPDLVGIWGGTTTSQRRRRRTADRKQHPHHSSQAA